MELAELNDITHKERHSQPPIRVRCCTATGCALSGNSPAVLKRLQESVQAAGLEKKVKVCGVGCMRLCSKGPLVHVDPQNELYGKVTVDNAQSIIGALQGEPQSLPSLADASGQCHTGPKRQRGFVQGDPVTAERCDPNSPFFALQANMVLENCGKIEPERIESYIAAEGYRALYKVLHEMTPAEVVDTITRSGLRGRGGAAFPTGVKWGTVAKSKGARKFVVCNADEGDPGAFMNRSVLEGDPHRVLEGMAIAGFAVGASQGYIYVRGEYPLASERLKTALKQATRMGLLGSHVFESPFDFRIDLRVGAGAFVCGEETALMASIMGERGSPRPRPPYPAECGLWGCPTLLNNVETFANVPSIIRRGAEWFASVGTAKSKGTKVFALSGKVRNTGLVEVPLGTPLRRIVEEIGGGAPGKGRIKAVQTGGPSGGCIPAEHLDTPVDYESLAQLGSIMGSGGMIVMDQDNDMVDVARFFMNFCVDESCGKCIPCRAGTVQLTRLLTKVIDGRATLQDLQLMEKLCDMVKNASLCGLGQAAPNPLLSTLRFFRNEYERRLVKG